jgi:hypothetical protein
MGEAAGSGPRDRRMDAGLQPSPGSLIFSAAAAFEPVTTEPVQDEPHAPRRKKAGRDREARLSPRCRRGCPAIPLPDHYLRCGAAGIRVQGDQRVTGLQGAYSANARDTQCARRGHRCEHWNGGGVPKRIHQTRTLVRIPVRVRGNETLLHVGQHWNIALPACARSDTEMVEVPVGGNDGLHIGRGTT